MISEGDKKRIPLQVRRLSTPGSDSLQTSAFACSALSSPGFPLGKYACPILNLCGREGGVHWAPSSHLHPRSRQKAAPQPLTPYRKAQPSQAQVADIYPEHRFQGSVKFSEGSHFLSTDFSIIFSWNCKSWCSEAPGTLISW